jgi:hypothetical protein
MPSALVLAAVAGWPLGEAQTPKVCAASVLNAGIFGGYHAYLLESGDLWIRDMYMPPEPRPLKERGYRLKIDRHQRWDLGRRVAAYDFLRLKNSRTPTVPDPHLVTVSVSICGKRPFVVTQVAERAAPSFWVVVDWFLIQMARAKNEPPVYEGEVAAEWQPPPPTEE